MKLITVLLLMFLAFTAKGQTPNNYVFRNIWERTHGAYPDSVQHIPTFCGVPPLLTTKSWKGGGALAYDTCNNKLYGYRDTAWVFIPDSAYVASIAGGAGVDTIYTRNDSLFYEKDATEYFVDEMSGDLTLITANKGATAAKQIAYASGDTLYFKKLGDGVFTTVTTANDSTNKVNADTAAMRTWIETFTGSGGALSYDSTYGNGTDSIWVDTTINRIAYRAGGFIFHVAITDSIPGIPEESFDADAEAFFTDAGITDDTEKDAYNDLVVTLKANGTSGTNKYAKMIAIYPFLGSSASTTKFNAVDPDDDDASFRITWSGGWTYDAMGVTGNGSTGAGNTHITPSTHFSALDAYLGAYINSNVQADTYDMGAYSGGDGIVISSRQNDGKVYAYANAAAQTGVTTATSIGYVSASHRTGPVHEIYKNGTSISTFNPADARVAYEIKIGCVNIAGADAGFSNRSIGIVLLGTAMSDAEDLDVYNAVLTFVTALGRN